MSSQVRFVQSFAGLTHVRNRLMHGLGSDRALLLLVLLDDGMAVGWEIGDLLHLVEEAAQLGIHGSSSIGRIASTGSSATDRRSPWRRRELDTKGSRTKLKLFLGLTELALLLAFGFSLAMTFLAFLSLWSLLTASR